MLKIYLQNVRGNEEIGRLMIQNKDNKWSDVFLWSRDGRTLGQKSRMRY